MIETAELPLDQLANEIIIARLFAQALEQSGKTAKQFDEENDIQKGLPQPDETMTASAQAAIVNEEEKQP